MGKHDDGINDHSRDAESYERVYPEWKEETTFAAQPGTISIDCSKTKIPAWLQWRIERHRAWFDFKVAAFRLWVVYTGSIRAAIMGEDDDGKA